MPEIKRRKPASPPIKDEQTISANEVGTVPVELVNRPVSDATPRPANMSTPPTPSGSLALPDIPGFLTQDSMPETAEQMRSGYIGFGEPRSVKNWPMISAAGVVEGQAYAARAGEIIPLQQLEFWLLRADSYKTAMKTDGSFSFATRDLEYVDPGTHGGKVGEHYIGLMIVKLPNGNYIPIKGDFRTTKSNALSGPINAVKAAGTPEWANQSDANKLAAQFQRPFGRVYHYVNCAYYVGKASGNASYPARSRSVPSTLSQLQELSALFTEQEFLTQLREANENYEGRIKFMDELCAKNK